MLKIEPPTKEILIKVLKLLIEDAVTREEVVRWQKEIIDHFNYYGPGVYTIPLTVNDGYWEFVSLSALLKKSEIQNDPHSLFIRKEDLVEYLSYLKHENYNEIIGDFRFIRPHQIMQKDRQTFPIVSINDRDLIRRNSLKSVRGIMDNLENLQELSLFIYLDSVFTCCLHHEHEPGYVDLYGKLDENKDKIVSLLNKLSVAPQNVDWISSELDSEKCKLVRLDDNGNEFDMKKFDSYILANLTRTYFESKGHKQMYSVIKDI